MITLEPEKIAGFDEDGDPVFTVEAFDEFVATVKLLRTGHTVESWQEMAEAITEA